MLVRVLVLSPSRCGLRLGPGVVLVVAAGILARGAWKSPSHSAAGVALDVGGSYLE